MIVVWLFLTICKTISDFPLSKKKGLALFIKVSRYLKVELKVSKGAEIRNQYNQVLHDPEGAQWLSDRVFDSRSKGRGFEPHRRHCVVVLEQDTFILA